MCTVVIPTLAMGQGKQQTIATIVYFRHNTFKDFPLSDLWKDGDRPINIMYFSVVFKKPKIILFTPEMPSVESSFTVHKMFIQPRYGFAHCWMCTCSYLQYYIRVEWFTTFLGLPISSSILKIGKFCLACAANSAARAEKISFLFNHRDLKMKTIPTAAGSKNVFKMSSHFGWQFKFSEVLCQVT